MVVSYVGNSIIVTISIVVSVLVSPVYAHIYLFIYARDVISSCLNLDICLSSLAIGTFVAISCYLMRSSNIISENRARKVPEGEVVDDAASQVMEPSS